eukprot:CAMPEP_0175806376 /NCGR_PEP_ID=MMETSP0107_2-20121207/1158_1 /TAXON_ID=195067 ORGANISM="Goniomonas pacifica, Strain CCMP1869" /NCGR_SAMPLE_ID=MMETSP0107_2 /ASSEMBLY_ACC=CAM_ASM_000203 /LENGTH=72 /DNA_ID=CAMNT_0017117863 /DNA_START=380 /DNA_END=595 /DNA_ORIENTATION=-
MRPFVEDGKSVFVSSKERALTATEGPGQGTRIPSLGALGEEGDGLEPSNVYLMVALGSVESNKTTSWPDVAL